MWKKKFSKTTARVDFGVAFSINFFSSSAFLGLRKALEQDAMSSSVSVVRRRKVPNACEIWFSYKSNFTYNIFFLVPNVHKSIIVINSIVTRYSRNVFDDVQ